MCLRIDLRIGLDDQTVGPDEEGDPFGERQQGAIGADSPGQLVIAVRKQEEWKGVLFGEPAVLFGTVERDPENLDAQFLKLVPAVTQLRRF